MSEEKGKPNVDETAERYNILVVDDSAVMRAMVIRTLELSSLPIERVYEAGDGVAALSIARRHALSAALIDINMPVMNGEELLACLRQEETTRNLPVLVVSTERSETRVARMLELNAGFLHKPFTPEGLRKQLLTILGVNGNGH